MVDVEIRLKEREGEHKKKDIPEFTEAQGRGAGQVLGSCVVLEGGYLRRVDEWEVEGFLE